VQNRAKIFLQKSIFLNAQCCLPVQTTEMLVVQSHWSMKKVPSSGLDAGTLCVNAFFFLIVFFLVFPSKKVRFEFKIRFEVLEKAHSATLDKVHSYWQYFNALEKSM
jgi:hypothetical protein